MHDNTTTIDKQNNKNDANNTNTNDNHINNPIDTNTNTTTSTTHNTTTITHANSIVRQTMRSLTTAAVCLFVANSELRLRLL